MSDAIGAEDARRLIAGGEAKAIDLRDDEAWRESRIAGALRFDDADPDKGLGELPEDVRLIVVGEAERAAKVAEQLIERGRDAAYLEGGLGAWKEEDYPIQPSEDPDEGAIV